MHDHHDHHRDYSDDKDVKNISIAFLLNLCFTAIEIIGGIWTNSIAILADSVHDLGDTLALGLAWFFQRLSKKGTSRKFSYGYKRFTILGALINSLILLIGSVFILTETIPRLIHPEESHSTGMIALAGLGIVVNGLAFFRVKSGQSLNERVVALHLLEDVLGWVAVLVGATIMHFTGWKIIDPILSIMIMVYIGLNVIKNLKKVIHIIMQGTPSEEEMTKLREYFESLEGVESYHDLHAWTLDGKYHVLTVHLVIPDSFKRENIIQLKQKVKADLVHHQIDHPTIEIEYNNEPCNLKDD